MSREQDTFLQADFDQLCRETLIGKIEHHTSIGSTNDRALELAQQRALPEPVLILTDHQTSGRGRGSNSWWAGQGALTFSLVLRRQELGLSSTDTPRLSLVSAIAVRQAISEFTTQDVVKLKWPNDVFIDQLKVAGLLLETSSTAPDNLVIGVGINVNNSMHEAPEEIKQRATSMLDSSGQWTSRSDLLLAIAKSMTTCFDQFESRELMLDHSWKPHCLLIDRAITIESGKRLVVGVCKGVSSEGSLLVETASGFEHVVSGIVTEVEGIESLSRKH